MGIPTVADVQKAFIEAYVADDGTVHAQLGSHHGFGYAVEFDNLLNNGVVVAALDNNCSCYDGVDTLVGTVDGKRKLIHETSKPGEYLTCPLYLRARELNRAIQSVTNGKI